jgi:hypothetical protein
MKTYKVEENSYLDHLITKLNMHGCSYADPRDKYSRSLLNLDLKKKEYTQNDLNYLEKQLIIAYDLNKQHNRIFNAYLTAANLSRLYAVLENNEKDAYWTHVSCEDEKLFDEQEKNKPKGYFR